MKNLQPYIIWFNADLRLLDNEPLAQAAKNGPIIPLYIHDEKQKLGKSLLAWRWHSLQDIFQSFKKRNINLIVRQGDIVDRLLEIADQTNAKGIYFHKSYEPYLSSLESELILKGREKGLDIKAFIGRLLLEPNIIKNKQNEQYKVYTPFSKNAEKNYKSGFLSTTLDIKGYNKKIESLSLDDIKPANADVLLSYWKISEEDALERLDYFLNNNLDNYDKMRNIPSVDGTSKLSPYLASGNISIHRIYHEIELYQKHNPYRAQEAEKFKNELWWRDFAYYTFHYNPDLKENPLDKKFEKFEWENNKEKFKAWKKGNTGFPLVDAGMKQLIETGWMHNRVRMVVASFLTKNLLLPWQWGEKWFWENLVDADAASNPFNWQWVAGCGVDAAPYFRIFNPILQSKKFDPEGTYIKSYLPELKKLTKKYIHEPTKAPSIILQEAGIELDKNYPQEIINLEKSRNYALLLYKKLNKTIA